MVRSPAFARFALLALGAVLMGCQPSPEVAPPTATMPIPSSDIARSHELPFRLGHASSSTSLYEHDAQAFLALIAQRTNGAVHGQSFPAGQLGNQQEMLEQVQLGTLEMVIGGSEIVSAVPEFGVFDLPFLFPDRAAVKGAVEGTLGAELTLLADRKNLIVLVYWENGYRQVTNNVRPIRTPEDLAGLRIRTPPNLQRVIMFHNWGAKAAPLDFTKLFDALQAGVFDGQENPIAQITSARLDEVQRYLSFTNHVYSPAYLLASKPWWASLDPDVQRALRDAALLTGDDSRWRGEEFDRSGEKLAIQAGMQVNHDVDRAAFQQASIQMYDDFKRRHGAHLLDLVQAAGTP
ncbi:MAG: DctP family TRAP transporter solute-binding subunit [Chloroflexi bacterium]|nr:DctP family TRAP transporter solute-binding subunit [Chloroflexota bacterium]